MSTDIIRVTWLHRMVSFIGAGYLRLVAATSFMDNFDHPSATTMLRRRAPHIFAFWHNQQVTAAITQRGLHHTVIISRSKDGEYIAQVVRRMGIDSVRGSTSRGGSQALRDMVKMLRKGRMIAFTPDGPRGPAGTVHGGAIAAARLSGAPVLCASAMPRRRIVFNSWDKFIVPLPFSRITTAHGKPFSIDDSMSDEAAASRVRAELDAATERAERYQRQSPGWWMSLAGMILYGLYEVLISLALPVILIWAGLKFGFKRTFRSFRERWGYGDVNDAGGFRVWCHSASVGEWQALRPLMERLERETGVETVVTCSTPEAREIIARDTGRPARLLPFDLPWLQRRWLSRLKPDALIIVETELWPGLIRECRRSRVPVFVVNGRMSEKSERAWRRLRPLAFHFLPQISRIFTRTDLDARRFTAVGALPDRVRTVGNLKYDRLTLAGDAERAAARRTVWGDEGGVALVGGSTWPGEDEMLIGLMGDPALSSARLILAPRRASRLDAVAALLDAAGIAWARWSDIKAGRSNWKRAVLVDTMGDLETLYRASDVAFVGGSIYPKGGQNPLEPAAAGSPVVFGPSMQNFHEEAALLARDGGGWPAANAAEAAAALKALLLEPERRARSSRAAAAAVRQMQGATARTVEALRAELSI